MRERLDFASVTKIILENRKAEELSYTEYYETLFAYAFKQSDIKISAPEQANINRIINGERNVPNDIAAIYEPLQTREELVKGVRDILGNVYDPARVGERLENLLRGDTSISDVQKEVLSENKDEIERFIAECIFFGMRRNFKARGKRADKSADKHGVLLSDYLLDYHFPTANKVFYGREQDLSVIHQRLGEDSCLFLSGIGGIGKSELAKQYGRQYKKEYEHVLYLRYNKSLRHTICELAFIDDKNDMDEDTLFQRHYAFFKSLSGDTLVVLDNFDVLPEQDELFCGFQGLSFRLLVTTRSVIDDVPCYLVQEIESMEALTSLFYAYAPKGKEKPDIVQGIIDESYKHTLTVEMAAKTMRAADLPPEDILVALRNEGLHLSSPNKIRIQKDGVIKKATPKEHLVRLFQLQHLSDERQAILRHMLLMPDSGIPKGLFGKWLGAKDFNSINELIDYGWIHEESESNRITMHPFLQEVLEIFDRPSFKGCSDFIEWLGQEYVVSVDEEIYFRDLINLTKSVFQKIEVDDASLAFHLLEKVVMYLEGYMYYATMGDMLNIMEDLIPMGAGHETETATYEFYRGMEALWGDMGNVAEKHFQNALTVLRPFERDNTELAIKLHNQLSYFYMLTGVQDKFLQHAKAATELSEQCGQTDSLRYNLEQVNLMLAKAMNQNEEAVDITTLLEAQQVKSFIAKAKETGKLNFSSEEFKRDVEKMELDELPEFLRVPVKGIKDGLAELISSEQEQIPAMDIFSGIMEAFMEINEN